MNEENQVILLGNGFNYSLLDFVTENDDLKGEIESIINLWNEFDDLIKNITTKFNLGSVEEAIGLIYKSFLILKLTLKESENLDYDECLPTLKKRYEDAIYQKVLKIIENFVSYEVSGIYRRLLSYLSKDPSPIELFGLNNSISGIYNLVRNNKISIYTTNYDALAEMVFSINENGMIKLPDMFKFCGDARYVCFYEDDFFDQLDKPKFLHLHGSYKFFKYYEQEIKIKKEFIKSFIQDNKDYLIPVLIFNAPSKKEQRIRSFRVLSNYNLSFMENISSSSKLIIWGQSLKSDPYLKQCIVDRFINKNNKSNN